MAQLIVTEFFDEALLAQAKSLSTEGYIVEHDTYCYLKIADNYIHLLHPMLTSHGAIAKPPYFHPPKEAGAHISVMYPAEDMIVQQQHVGQKHHFEVLSLIKAQYGLKEYFALAVHAPSLAYLRQVHGLKPKPRFKGQPIVFHITIGMLDRSLLRGTKFVS